MEALTKKQQAILDYMREHVTEHSYWPSIRDIQAKFRFASTNAVIGDVGFGTITETLPLRPLTPYGATKAAAEMELSAYAGSYGIITSPNRFTTPDRSSTTFWANRSNDRISNRVNPPTPSPDTT